MVSNFKQKFQSFKVLISLCGTKSKVKRKTAKNVKNYCLNEFLRGQLLYSKVKTGSIALNLLKVF